MAISISEPLTAVACGARFDADRLIVELSDGRQVSLDTARIPWLAWLHRASPEQRRRWEIEPGGFALYWPDLDDGVEVAHILSTSEMA